MQLPEAFRISEKLRKGGEAAGKRRDVVICRRQYSSPFSLIGRKGNRMLLLSSSAIDVLSFLVIKNSVKRWE